MVVQLGSQSPLFGARAHTWAHQKADFVHSKDRRKRFVSGKNKQRTNDLSLQIAKTRIYVQEGRLLYLPEMLE